MESILWVHCVSGNDLCWCESVNVLQEKYFFRLYEKEICRLKKNMMGWNSKPEIFHEDKTHESPKKRLQIFFYSVHGENTI